MEVNDNPVLLRDPKAARLVRERAEKEHRSAANAAAVSIIEYLGIESNNPQDTTNNTKELL